MENVYKKVRSFKNKYPSTIVWRLKKHSKVIQQHLNPDEHILYAFAGQNNKGSLELFYSCAVVLTNKRLIIGKKRVLWGYFLTAITPDMYNDLTVKCGLIWGNIVIDTIKEVVEISNISRDALDEIETNITEFMMDEKKKYFSKNVNEN